MEGEGGGEGEEEAEDAVVLSSRLSRGRRQQVDVRLTRSVLTWKDVKKTTKCGNVGFGHFSGTGEFKKRLSSNAMVVSFPAICLPNFHFLSLFKRGRYTYSCPIGPLLISAAHLQCDQKIPRTVQVRRAFQPERVSRVATQVTLSRLFSGSVRIESRSRVSCQGVDSIQGVEPTPQFVFFPLLPSLYSRCRVYS